LYRLTVQMLSEPVLLLGLIEVAFGIALLGRAADMFVEGAANLANAARVSPVLVGAVVVGFGTSAPELLVSGIAAVDGDLDLGMGNIVGSNVANLTLVLGSAALIVPLLVSRLVIAREAPLSLASVLLFAFVSIGGLQRWEGIVLLVVLTVSLGWLVSTGIGDARQAAAHAAHSAHERAEHGVEGVEAVANPGGGPPQRNGRLGTRGVMLIRHPWISGSLMRQVLRTVFGLIGTVAGAQLLVWGAKGTAATVGLSGGFVGFTLVAVGTSLPELVTSVVAARRGATELLLGNLLGSNMFNSLAVGGAIAVVGPGSIDDRGLATIGMVVMVLAAVTAWVFMITRRRVFRLEGVTLLVGWLVAVALLARTATETALALGP
jgi:cation:H+ antiporter